ncbi:MAG: glycosyltransferase [Vicingaceae bacterium]|nr:glycosyltransferase [Vicingaceae bacterium]
MNFYLNKYSFREKLITENPSSDLGLIVVIPCCSEANLIETLQSLLNCQLPNCGVEVIVVINASEIADKSILDQNKISFNEASEWISNNKKEGIKFYLINENALPKKYAGVGLARKIGMDEAVRRFDELQKDGVIICFDADSQCEENYLVEIERHFKNNPKTPACSIHFEHPIDGAEFSDEIYNGIVQYELHLRYYKNGLDYAGLPYAFHTIGSSMAVRSSAYQKQNGMNKRKAGEDFYFLQKLIPLGGFTEIKTTKVIPSPRISDRVPFGTGRAMQDWLLDDRDEMLSYNPKSFVDLKDFVELVPKLYGLEEILLPNSINQYLDEIDFQDNLLKVRRNSTSENHFVKLFFNWFNAFKVLKLMHYLRDNFYPDVNVFEGANALLELSNKESSVSHRGLLVKYREIDQN